MNTFRDLDFLVPENMTTGDDIKKAFVYIDDIKEGGTATDYLNTRVCQELRSKGLVRLYNASMSKKFRKTVMCLYCTHHSLHRLCWNGEFLVFMINDLWLTLRWEGCNISDVEVVVQWKTPRDLSSWVQRAGCAVRGPGRQGLAVMIDEKFAFEVISISPDDVEDGSDLPMLG